MDWFVFTLIAIFFSVAYGLVSKRILGENEENDPLAYASLLFFSVTIYSLIFYLFTSYSNKDLISLTNLEALCNLALVILFYTIAPSLYYRALKELPASEVAILYTPTSIYILIIGLLTKMEQFSLARVFGAILVFLSVILITYKRGKWEINKSVFFMIISTFFYAMAAIGDKIIIERNYFSNLFYQCLTFGLPAICILIANATKFEKFQTVLKNSWKKIFINGFFAFIYFFAIYKAYSLGGQVSQVNLIFSAETVVTVILAAIFLRETKNLTLKTIAGILTGIGIYLIK